MGRDRQEIAEGSRTKLQASSGLNRPFPNAPVVRSHLLRGRAVRLCRIHRLPLGTTLLPWVISQVRSLCGGEAGCV